MTADAAAPAAGPAPADRGTPIVTMDELVRELSSPTPPVLLDVRWSLAGNGLDAFLAGRIPGAVFVDLDTELAAPAGAGGRHPLPALATLQGLFARAGIGPETPVVVTGAGNTSIAARAWWLVRWAGHPDVRVLDGGFAAWQAAGLPVASGPADAGPADAGTGAQVEGAAVTGGAVTGGAMPTVDADGAAALGQTAGSVLLDARAAERYRGEVEPVDPVPGHIPGAVNLPLAEVHAADGRLKPADELRRIFAELGVRDGVTVAASCGSGVTACSLILAGEVAGLKLALYPGSYSGWCALGRPVEAG